MKTQQALLTVSRSRHCPRPCWRSLCAASAPVPTLTDTSRGGTAAASPSCEPGPGSWSSWARGSRSRSRRRSGVDARHFPWCESIPSPRPWSVLFVESHGENGCQDYEISVCFEILLTSDSNDEKWSKKRIFYI